MLKSNNRLSTITALNDDNYKSNNSQISSNNNKKANNLINFKLNNYVDEILSNAFTKSLNSSNRQDSHTIFMQNIKIKQKTEGKRFDNFSDFKAKNYIDSIFVKVKKKDMSYNVDGIGFQEARAVKKTNYHVNFVDSILKKTSKKSDNIFVEIKPHVRFQYLSFDQLKKSDTKPFFETFVSSVLDKVFNKKNLLKISNKYKFNSGEKHNEITQEYVFNQSTFVSNMLNKAFKKKVSVDNEKFFDNKILNHVKYVDDILNKIEKKVRKDEIIKEFKPELASSYVDSLFSSVFSKKEIKSNTVEIIKPKEGRASLIDSGISFGKGKVASKRKGEFTENEIKNKKVSVIDISPKKSIIKTARDKTYQNEQKDKTRQSSVGSKINNSIRSNNSSFKDLSKVKKPEIIHNQNTNQYSVHDSAAALVQNKFKSFKQRTILMKLRMCAYIIQRNFRKYIIRKYNLPDNYFFNDKFVKILNSRQEESFKTQIRTLFPLLHAEEYCESIKNDLMILQNSLNDADINPSVKQETFNFKISQLGKKYNLEDEVVISFYSYFINNKFKKEFNLKEFFNLRSINTNVHDKDKIFLFNKVIDFDLIVELDESDKFDFASEYQNIFDYNLKNNNSLKTISLGGQHCLILNSKGKVYSFGWNNEGQCGFPKNSTVILRQELGTNFLVDSNEYNETIVQNINSISPATILNPQSEDKILKEKPYLNYNNVLFGLTNPNPVVNVLFDEIINAKDCSCGEEQSFILDDKGLIWAFGDNSFGQLGLGHCNPVDKPTMIVVNKEKDEVVRFSSVKCEDSVTFAVSTDGCLYMWPTTNKNGEINAFPLRINIYSPYSATGNSKGPNNQVKDYVNNFSSINNPYLNNQLNKQLKENISFISCGNNFALICTSTGLLYSFGKNNTYGQLGHGDVNPRSRPTLIETLAVNKFKIDQIACGFKHCIARSSTGKVFSWGLGSKGQLGLGDFSSSALPQQILAFKNSKVYQIAAGFNSSYFLLEQRKLYVSGGSSLAFIPQYLNICERYPEFANEKNYSLLKIYCTWNRFYSVLYATCADTTTMNGALTFKTNQMLCELSKKWINDNRNFLK